MKAEYGVEELVPHSGKMSLLSEIVSYGDDWLEAKVEISPDSMFSDDQGVPSWVGLEYLAQSIGAFAGLQERRTGGSPRIGFLLGSRRYQCSSDYFLHGDVLTLRVEEEMSGDNGLSVFSGLLTGTESSGGVEASARLNVFQPDDAAEFLEGK